MALLSSPTLQELITSVREILNQTNPNNSFWTDVELSKFLNEGIRIYFQEVVHNNEGLFTVTEDLNIVSGVETIDLPVDFFKARAVYKKVSDGYVILPYRNNVTEGFSTAGGSALSTYFPYYMFRGNQLVLRPTPNFNETGGIRLEYIQFPDTMIYGGDGMTAQVSPVFKQVIEMYAVYKAKVKESMVNGVDTTALAKQNLNELYTLFRNAIDKRSTNPTYVIPYNPEGGSEI